ncbi:galactosylceramide sulfotransferase-like [Saccoglossus kowalevskii]|uniref:Galactosylceramide sulfotransferase-like n=1 Tax=Saccoglossus kowalevskii TaxID=10224 RepID=A0ABM0M101_SACKO|nr:PREDICTED: galactosylceramide sulfotransferase-like [Saccoglossus kowalevskii]
MYRWIKKALIITFVCVVSIYGFLILRTEVFMLSPTKSKDVDIFAIYGRNGQDETILEMCLRRLNSSMQCNPTKKVIFIKTHKTGSSTIASILQRYVYTKNLTMALPKASHFFSLKYLFKQYMVTKKSNNRTYDMLTNHARYNRPELEAVIPNATYITILRYPVAQFESAFGYFQWDKLIPKSFSDPIGEFFRNFDKYVVNTNSMRGNTRNGQLFDLGLSPQETLDAKKVSEKINALHSEFDLVLVTEYFDESLILLRDKLCWSLDDILYISSGIRSDGRRRSITTNTKEQILEWNNADLKLYEHFKGLLLDKISTYGPCFEYHLQELRQRQAALIKECTEPNLKNNARENSYVLIKNAPPHCSYFLNGDVKFTKLLKKRIN